MLVTADGFSALLQTLGLVQGLSKPTPGSAGYSVGGSTNIVNETSSGLGVPSPSVADLGDFQAQSVQVPSLLSPSTAQILDQSDPTCRVDPYYTSFPLNQTFPPFDETKANVYRYRQQQSVNIGSW